MVNAKTMCLHVTVLFIHTLVVLVTQAITYWSFVHPTPKSSDTLNISRIVLFGSQTISQVIVVYLFLQFSMPKKIGGIDNDGQAMSVYESDSEELEDTHGRENELDMLWCIRSMPKMEAKAKVDFNLPPSDSSAVAQLHREGEESFLNS
jgi:hypothetical protein